MDMCLLKDVEEGEVAVLHEFLDLPFERQKRLIELGLTSGSKIKVVKNLKKAGEMMIVVRSYALSLDYLVASKISVCKGESKCKK